MRLEGVAQSNGAGGQSTLAFEVAVIERQVEGSRHVKERLERELTIIGVFNSRDDVLRFPSSSPKLNL